MNEYLYITFSSFYCSKYFLRLAKLSLLFESDYNDDPDDDPDDKD